VKEIFCNARENKPLNDILLKSGLLRFFAILAGCGDLCPADGLGTAKSEKITLGARIHERTFFGEHYDRRARGTFAPK